LDRKKQNKGDLWADNCFTLFNKYYLLCSHTGLFFFLILHLFYRSLPSLIISTISSDVIFAFIEGTSKGEDATFSGIKAKVRPSFLRIITLPVL
jgi:hypothetical protein